MIEIQFQAYILCINNDLKIVCTSINDTIAQATETDNKTTAQIVLVLIMFLKSIIVGKKRTFPRGQVSGS